MHAMLLRSTLAAATAALGACASLAPGGLPPGTSIARGARVRFSARPASTRCRTAARGSSSRAARTASRPTCSISMLPAGWSTSQQVLTEAEFRDDRARPSGAGGADAARPAGRGVQRALAAPAGLELPLLAGRLRLVPDLDQRGRPGHRVELRAPIRSATRRARANRANCERTCSAMNAARSDRSDQRFSSPICLKPRRSSELTSQRLP